MSEALTALEEVVKTVVVHAVSGLVLVAVPGYRRLDMPLVRTAVGDNHARLATEEELARDFSDYELGALPPLGSLVGAHVYVDPEVMGHDTVVFALREPRGSSRRRRLELLPARDRRGRRQAGRGADQQALGVRRLWPGTELRRLETRRSQPLGPRRLGTNHLPGERASPTCGMAQTQRRPGGRRRPGSDGHPATPRSSGVGLGELPTARLPGRTR